MTFWDNLLRYFFSTQSTENPDKMIFLSKKEHYHAFEIKISFVSVEYLLFLYF